MNHRAGDDSRIAEGAGIGDGEITPGAEQAVHGGTVDRFDLRGLVCLPGPLVRRHEPRPDALNGIDERNVGDLVPAGQHGAATADPGIQSPQGLVEEAGEAVVAGDAVDTAHHQAVTGAADLRLGDIANRTRVSRRPVPLRVVRGLAHHHRFPLQLGRAGEAAGDEPGHFWWQAAQTVNAGSIEPARTAEEITIERHVRDEAFLHEQTGRARAQRRQ